MFVLSVVCGVCFGVLVLIVDVCPLDVVMWSLSFVRFGSHQILGILKLAFSAFYVVWQLNGMCIAEVPWYAA